jgi:hypothetical protein
LLLLLLPPGSLAMFQALLGLVIHQLLLLPGSFALFQALSWLVIDSCLLV